MFKIAVISDAHAYARELGIEGNAFRLRSDLDQRLLAESGAIIDAALESIAASGADCLLFAGDMTNDGESASHDLFREKIRAFSEKMPVYVVFATHDWCCDGHPKRFNGDIVFNDVPTKTPEELREYYRDFGEAQSESVYINEIGAASYALSLNDDIRLIALNDDKNGKGCAGYCPEHLEWILSEARAAKARGQAVIVMEHHLVIAHTTPLITSGMCIGDRDEMAEKLAEAGVDVILCGHSHMLDTACRTAANGNVVTQINVGSICGYPAPIDYLVFDNGSCVHDVEFLEGFDYEGRHYTLDYMKEHLRNVLADMVRSASSDRAEFCERLCSIGVSRKTANSVFTAIRPLAAAFMKVSVGTAGKIINGLTFGKGINKAALAAVADDNLFEHVLTIFTNVFDGVTARYAEDDPVYIIVRDLASLPRRIINRIPGNKISTDFCGKIELAARELTGPSEPDSLHAEIHINKAPVES